MPTNGTLKSLLSWSGVLIALIGAIWGYGVLHGQVDANASNITENSERLGKIESKTGDIRERLKALETGQEYQTDILERIERKVEGR